MKNLILWTLTFTLGLASVSASARFIQADPVGTAPTPGTPLVLPGSAGPVIVGPRAITSADVLGFHHLNHSYAYVSLNPVKYVDPSGLLESDPAYFLNGGAAGQSFASSVPYPQNYNDPLQVLPGIPPLPPGASCMDKCEYFKSVCYGTAGGSGFGLNRVVVSVVSFFVPEARITATIAGAVIGGVATQNLSLECQKAFRVCREGCNTCL